MMRAGEMRSWSKWIVIVLAGLLGSCGATPIPDPPDLDPPDRERIVVSPIDGLVMAVVDIEGEPGSAAPGTIVHAVPLDNARAPSLGVVAEDGSFRVESSAARGEEIRLTYRAGAVRSLPLDLVIPIDPGRPELARRDPCVVVPAELDLGELEPGDGAVLPITVENTCGSAITVTTRLRRSSAVLAIADANLTIAAGERATIEATFDPSGEGAYEEVAFVDVAAPIEGRYPVTLFGIARE